MPNTTPTHQQNFLNFLLLHCKLIFNVLRKIHIFEILRSEKEKTIVVKILFKANETLLVYKENLMWDSNNRLLVPV